MATVTSISSEGAFDASVRTLLNTNLANLNSAKLEWVTKPAAANSTGTAGQVAYESGYLYVCVSANTWQRVQIATWS
jgi:hypothetical protein